MVGGCPTTARSQTGSRPGDPLADVVYGFAAARIRRQIGQRLEDEGLTTCVPWDGRRSVIAGAEAGVDIRATDVLYADDGAVLFAAPAADIEGQVRRGAEIVMDGYADYGLTLNRGRARPRWW